MNAVGARPAGPLVSTAWLESNLSAPAVRIIDIRGKVLPPGNAVRYLAKTADYEAAHIPGARFLDWTTEIVDAADPIPMQLAPPRSFAETMGRLGVGDDTIVVAYDDYSHIFAGRLAWALRYYGHDAAFVLDGGWSRWTAEGKPVSTERPSPRSATFTPRERPGLRRAGADLAKLLGSPDVLIVDARAPDQYAGETSVARRGGHIPGARNVHYTELLDPARATFRPPADLARAFARAGVDVSQLPPDIVVYCNSGVSCTTVLNAFRLLGRDDVAVYDGSWNEWGNDEARPIVRGTDP